jgi:leucyl/phenylalanyl-tRNA--protein transferase
MPAFNVDDLIHCYRTGVFPMADSRLDETLFLVDPELRGILDFENFYIPSRLRRTLRATSYEVRIDTAFDKIISLCAEDANNRPSTWISLGLESLYKSVFARGQAHSIEVWHEEKIVGGLYGVALGGAFFGESMVSRARDASKIALIHLVARLMHGGFLLLDCQFQTPHLSQFGVQDIERNLYLSKLNEALAIKADIYALPNTLGGDQILTTIAAYKSKNYL